ncbi:type VII secretion integral membrane protein EccD [Pilimelia anulata]|nr:type VII secretion integral membrane protein EccD [Pilimelia anulata]
MAAGLVRLTVSAPARRLDLAVPAHAPLAELLPEILRHAGEELADAGEEHGGWALRRLTGEPLDPAAHLYAQGVRDGAVLHLVPAGARWPEPEYDDVVEVVADAARRQGAGWDAARTRRACLAAGGVLLAVPLAGLVAAGGPAYPAAVVAGTLAAAGVVAARVYGDRGLGVALTGYALPYALAGGALAVAAGGAGRLPGLDWLGAPQLLVGGVALAVAALAGLLGAAAGRRVHVAGLFAGGGAALAGLAGYAARAETVAAVALAALVCGLGLLPLLAIRLGRVPVPAPAEPAGDAAPTDALPDPAAVGAAVARTAALLVGLLAGHAVLCAGAVLVLVGAGGPAAAALGAVAGAALLLRARVFAAVAQRVPVLAAGLAALALVGLGLAAGAGPVALGLLAAVLPAAAVAAMLLGAAERPVSPYLGRLADLLDTAALVSIVPVACAVLGVYGQVRVLVG